MSDSILEEESLISQDDIDKLLDASSLEEAEERLDAPEVEDDLDMDDFGELSQDDIDSLLSGPDEPPAAEDTADQEAAQADADEGGELSQDDIDSLLGGGGDDDDAGELSQDDIDSLLGGGDDEDEAGELSQDDIDSLLGGGDEGDGDTELISQDDIDSLMNSAPEDEAIGGSGEEDSDDDDDELISMDDIQDIIGSSDSGDDGLKADGPKAGGADGESPLEDALETMDSIESFGPDDGQNSAGAADVLSDPLDDPISEDEAVAVNDCLITQATMDELIQNAPDLPAEPDIPPDTDPLDLQAESDPLDTIDLDAPVDLSEAEDVVDLDVADDGLDSLLDETDGAVDLDLDSEAAGDVTQEDIDALLQESDDGDDFLDDDDDILISQDDIDTLLMAADQEDEDVLGDLLGDAVDDSMDDFDDQEVVSGNAEETEQVVLVERDEPAGEAGGETSQRSEKIKRLLKSKLVLAAISVFLVLGISVPAVYFIFFSGKPVPLPEKEMVPVAVDEPVREVSVASVSIEDEPAPVIRQSGTIVLTDFIVLASDLEKEMTYVVADISIDYSDQRAYHEINNNLSFYRDLIYEAIQTSLVSEKRNEVTEADLLWGVENSLKKVLPPRFIEKISFKAFRTS